MASLYPLYAPWRLVENWRGKLAVVDTRNDGRHTETGRVCNLPRGKDNHGLAIGRLIAAAPDLYEALRLMMIARNPGFREPWEVERDRDEAYDAARAAIAKAEGN